MAFGETEQEATQRALAECGEKHLCVWDKPGFEGTVLTYYYCDPPDLAFEEFPDGQAGSFLNYQTPDATAVFSEPVPELDLGWWVGAGMRRDSW
ncbi:peptidase inhibitor family I36 protein [Saccharopolyspora flava]|uniref:peptidase inhibitor family I36 protein n=1 Tax=Saccharopolyspora flava TaxID=95161 RepID=UPI00158781B9|nr:peptidase inhibitor family I36 protein [Saccharopolyspora flava]